MKAKQNGTHSKVEANEAGRVITVTSENASADNNMWAELDQAVHNSLEIADLKTGEAQNSQSNGLFIQVVEIAVMRGDVADVAERLVEELERAGHIAYV